MSSLLIVILFIILLLLSILFAKIWIAYHHIKFFNQCPLDIKTFDGLDSPYHPSILFFENGWNGYKYWLVETPFSPHCKPYWDRNECPSIHVSNDGIDWSIPKGLTNPICNFDKEGEKNLDYYSDPHLVMVNDTMECWYRLTERHGCENSRNDVSLRKMITKDGVNWNNEIVVSKLIENNPNEGLGNMVMSPALVYLNFEYKIWFVDNESQAKIQRNVAFSTSQNGKEWSNKKICKLNGPKINVWHLDVTFSDNAYWLVAYDLHDLTLWKSNDGENFSFIKILLTPSVRGSFYGDSLYRASLVKCKNIYRLYFSALNIRRTYIGIMEGESVETLQVISAKKNGEIYSTFYDFCEILYLERKRWITFIIKNFYRTKIKKIISNR